MSCILAVLDIGEVQLLTMLLDGIDVFATNCAFHLSMTVIVMVTLVIILCTKMAT